MIRIRRELSLESLISVIIPVYNTEAYLDRCLQSIINQTYTCLDIILVDDGSSDRCPFLCDIWSEKDKRIRVIHKENGGVSSARNAGLKVAKGDWISFVDADDWIHPQYYEIMMLLATKSITNIIAANHWRIEDDQLSNNISIDQLEYRIIAGKNIFNHWDSRFFVWGKLYAKDIIDGHIFDEKISYGEDSLFNIEVLSQTDINIMYTTEKLYYYFIRSGSAVSNNRQKKRVDLCKAYLKYADLEKNEYVKRIYLESAVRRALSTRYDASVQCESKEIISDCNTCLRKALKPRIFWKESMWIYCMYMIFYCFSSVYRWWRIKNDPTLLVWENNNRRMNKCGKGGKRYNSDV